MRRATLLLADDHAIILDGLRRILEDDFEIVGTVTDGRALLSSVDALRPDVVLLDVSMPLLNGIDAARQLKKEHPDARIIFVTMHPDVEIARQAMAAGASGYILKHSPATEIIAAIERVLNGHTHLSPLVTKDLRDPCMENPGRVHELPSPLSMREKEVLQLVAEGCSHKEVAATLNISIKTAQFHRHNIMNKLGLRTVAELTQYAIKHHMVHPLGGASAPQT